jgi:hypothetical protein
MMRAVLGVVSLLIVVAVIGIIASRQLKSNSRAITDASPSTSSSARSTDAATPTAPPATVREQSQQLQQRARDDVTRALEQGAAARKGAEVEK